jgi:hypothetical protein
VPPGAALATAFSPTATRMTINLANNAITDIAALVNNAAIGNKDTVDLRGNPLSQQALCTQIPALKARGVTVYHDGVCGEYSIHLLRIGPGAASIHEIDGNHIELHATANSGGQFIRWEGVGIPWDGQILSQNPVFETDLTGEPYHRTVRAVFAEAQHVLDLRAALENVTTFSPGARWHTWDINDNAGGLAPNQIPDGYEFYLLERILVEGSALPGVTQAMFETVVTAWTSIRADVAEALAGRANAAGIDAIAAYLTLGNIGSRAAANYVVSRNWPGSGCSNTATYGNPAVSAITILARNQDPDADGFTNVQEYQFAALHYPDIHLRAEKYVEAALNPDIPGAGYDPAAVDKVTVDIVVHGQETTNPPSGQHTFARYLPQPPDCPPCPHSGEIPLGCEPCQSATLQLEATPADGWLFVNWSGTDGPASVAANEEIWVASPVFWVASPNFAHKQAGCCRGDLRTLCGCACLLPWAHA